MCRCNKICFSQQHSSQQFVLFLLNSIPDCQLLKNYFRKKNGFRGFHSGLNVCKVSRYCSCKTSPNQQPSATVLDSWYEVFVLICCVWFSLNKRLCIITKHLHFVSSVQKTLFQKSCDFFQMPLYKPKPWCHVLLREKNLSPANRPYLLSLFLIVLS